MIDTAVPGSTHPDPAAPADATAPTPRRAGTETPCAS